LKLCCTSALLLQLWHCSLLLLLRSGMTVTSSVSKVLYLFSISISSFNFLCYPLSSSVVSTNTSISCDNQNFTALCYIVLHYSFTCSRCKDSSSIWNSDCRTGNVQYWLWVYYPAGPCHQVAATEVNLTHVLGGILQIRGEIRSVGKLAGW